jgi:hypothetical protein
MIEETAVVYLEEVLAPREKVGPPVTPKPTSSTGKPDSPSRTPRAGVARAQPSPHERHVREVVDTLNALDAAQAIINQLAGPDGELPEDCPRPALEVAAKTAVVGRGAVALRERACDLIEEISVAEIAAQNAMVASSWFEVADASVVAMAFWLLLPFDQDGDFDLDSVWIALNRTSPETRISYLPGRDGSLLVRSWSGGVGIEAVAKSHCLTACLDELLDDIGLEQ